jgi:hypothetical protein
MKGATKMELENRLNKEEIMTEDEAEIISEEENKDAAPDTSSTEGHTTSYAGTFDTSSTEGDTTSYAEKDYNPLTPGEVAPLGDGEGNPQENLDADTTKSEGKTEDSYKIDEPEMDDESLIKFHRFVSLGLTREEALRAIGYKRKIKRPLTISPISVSTKSISIPEGDLKAARQIFTGLSDREINSLYRRVTEN